MIFNNVIYNKFKHDTDKFLKFLHECKFSGSWDTKVDINQIIKLINHHQFIINFLFQEKQRLEEELKKFEGTTDNENGVKINLPLNQPTED